MFFSSNFGTGFMEIENKSTKVERVPPIVFASILSGVLSAVGLVLFIELQVSVSSPLMLALAEQVANHAFLDLGIGLGVASLIGFYMMWRTAPTGNSTRMITFLLLLCLLLGGSAYNLATFKETNSSWLFGIKRNSKGNLAAMIARSPDKYNGIEVFQWFRLHAAGSVLYGSRHTIGTAGLAAHRMAAIGLVRMEELLDWRPEALRQARLTVADTKDWVRLPTPSNIEMRIDPDAAHPRAKLCAWLLTETVVLVTSAEKSICEGAAR